MKLKKLSLAEWLLLFLIVSILLVNVFLQLEMLRYLMWGLVAVVVVLNLMLETCPGCGKRVRNNAVVCPRCGKQLVETDDLEAVDEE